MVSMLIRMMLAQAQECLFEKTALPGIRNQFSSLMKMAQEAAKVNGIKGTVDRILCLYGQTRHSTVSLAME